VPAGNAELVCRPIQKELGVDSRSEQPRRLTVEPWQFA
jgi:hypothetical protein